MVVHKMCHDVFHDAPLLFNLGVNFCHWHACMMT